MKHIFAMFIVLSFCHARACDGCNAFSSFFQHQQRHSLGIALKSRILEGEVPSGLKHLGHLNSLYKADILSEHYNTFTLNGRYSISPRWSILASLPLHQRVRFQNGNVREYNMGIGDASTLVEFKPILTKSDAFIKYIWLARVGVKAPTGATQKKYGGTYLDHDFQLGSGSYDFIISNIFFLEKQRLGLTASHLYKKNTANLTNYRYGNTHILDLLLTFSNRKEERSLVISMGLNAEIQHKNQYSNKYFEDNSYTLLSSKTRIYLYRNGMELFTELIIPIKQQYNQLETLPFKMNVEVGVNLLIDRK